MSEKAPGVNSAMLESMRQASSHSEPSSGASIPGNGQGMDTKLGGEVGASLGRLNIDFLKGVGGVGNGIIEKFGGGVFNQPLTDGVDGSNSPFGIQREVLSGLGMKGKEGLGKAENFVGEARPPAIGFSASKASEGRGGDH